MAYKSDPTKDVNQICVWSRVNYNKTIKEQKTEIFNNNMYSEGATERTHQNNKTLLLKVKKDIIKTRQRYIETTYYKLPDFGQVLW